MKKLVLISLVLILAAGMVFAQTFRTGTFTGRGQGFYAPITVSVTFDNNRMTAITVTQHTDTEEFAFMVFGNMIPRMIAAQSADIDLLSGATATSRGLREAVQAAISQARQ